MGQWVARDAFALAQQEELELRRDLVAQSEPRRRVECGDEHRAWIAREALAVRHQHVADQAGDAVAVAISGRAPGHLGIGAQTWPPIHVGLTDPRESLEARSIEPL